MLLSGIDALLEEGRHSPEEDAIMRSRKFLDCQGKEVHIVYIVFLLVLLRIMSLNLFKVLVYERSFFLLIYSCLL
jgi:hypothetical protein